MEILVSRILPIRRESILLSLNADIHHIYEYMEKCHIQYIDQTVMWNDCDLYPTKNDQYN